MARGTQALDASRRVCRIWDRASILRKPRSFAKRAGIGRSVTPRREFLLRETKGLGYIAHLLPKPGAVSHLLGLCGELRARAKLGLPRGDEDLEEAGIRVIGLGDAGEMLDEQAKAAYRHRLSDLHGLFEILALACCSLVSEDVVN